MNITNRALRIAAAFLMIASIIWGYWWVTWSLAIIFLFLFPTYFEIILWGISYDALYGLSIPQFEYFRFVFTVASFILFIAIFYFKKLLLVYEHAL